MPFRESHEVIGRMVAHCIGAGCAIEDLDLATLRGFSPLIGEDVYEAIAIETCVRGRQVPGGPAREAVEAAILSARARL